jgi:predicted Zn-dependent protease
MEQPAPALRAFDAALHLRPDFGLAHVGRAEALHNLGRNQEAWQAVAAARAVNTEPGLDLLRRLDKSK